jgi:mersacidin/lichenicidin family type 2 lantibiotic
MNRVDLFLAWKDEAYRSSLSDAERAALPENPAGLV